MLRQNLMNGLLGITALGALLTGYNAFVAKKVDGKTSTDKLSSYLGLPVTKQEKSEDESVNNVAVDDSKNSADVTVDDGKTKDGVKSETPMSSQTPSATAKAGVDKPATEYTVKEGDTYGCIAEKYYGSYEHWPDVMAANPVTEGYAEYRLFVGAKLVLPAVPSASLKPASTLCS
jgi:LysM repeat protein